ncbi:Transient receptor potential cation channel [Oopsacas minuta]|uniref:Transient receptor potential cation channel n=1 Tax=Oopsacas minuta TaxID=111878 RepID=A0AAV7JCW5_9METZ|nr:Transient receptor potential cation channel [Oopsacas minuta]
MDDELSDKSLFFTVSSTAPKFSKVASVDDDESDQPASYDLHQVDDNTNPPCYQNIEPEKQAKTPSQISKGAFETKSLNPSQLLRARSNPLTKKLAKENKTFDIADAQEFSCSPFAKKRMFIQRQESISDSKLDQEFARELRITEDEVIAAFSHQEAIRRADSEVSNCQKILLQRQIGRTASPQNLVRPTRLHTRMQSADSKNTTPIFTSANLPPDSTEFSHLFTVPDIYPNENLPLLDTTSDPLIDITFKGQIHFPTRHGHKDASYITLPSGRVPDNIMDTLIDKWDLPLPTIILSFPGNAQLSNNSRFRQVLKDNIIRIAATTKVWFLTDGVNRSISAFLGSCLESHAYKRCAKREQNQRGWLIGSNYTEYDNPVPMIGLVCPEKVYKGNILLETNAVSTSITYSRESQSVLPDKDLLDVNHSHFILLRNSKSKSSVAEQWSVIEDNISNYLKQGSEALPVVRIFIDDTLQIIDKVCQAVKKNVVTVVISNNDLMQTIHDFIFRLAARDQKIGAKEHGKFLDSCRHYLGNESNSRINEVIAKISVILENFYLVTMFDMNLTYGADLSKAIVVALLKSKKSTGKDKMKEALGLVIDWNRVDLAEQDIFTESLIWGDTDLFQHFFKILHINQVEFLDLMLERNVIDVETFVEHHLERLYFDAVALNNNSPLFTKLLELSQIKAHTKQHTTTRTILKKKKSSQHKENIRLTQLQGDKEKIPINQIGKLIRYIINRSFKSIYEEYSQSEIERKVIKDYPIDNLFVWAILTHRWKMAEILLSYSKSVVFNAIAAKALISGMYNRLKDVQVVSESDLEILQGVAKKFELTAVGIMEEAYKRDYKRSHLMLQQKNKLFDDNNCIEMAVSGHCMTFLSHPCVQTLLDLQWKKPLYRHNPVWKKLLAIFFPFLIFILIEFNEPHPNSIIGYLRFYDSPSIKFITHVLSFLLYLLLYCYVVLFQWYPFPNLDPSEWIFILWSITIVAEEARQLFGGSGRLEKRWLGYFRDRWNQFDTVFVVCFILGTVLRLIPQVPLLYSKHMYALFGFILFFRILQFLIILRDSGPFVYMVFRMLKNLTHFVIIALVFLLAYGVPSQAILYPDIPRNSNNSYAFVIGNIFFRPYFQAFGEFFLQHSNSNTGGSFRDSNPELYLSSKVFVFIFLLVWIILSNILLVNIIIAKFNNTFVEIESNAALYWKYKFFNSVSEFRGKPVLPPPFNVIVIGYRCIRRIILWFNRCAINRSEGECDFECQERKLLFEYEKRCVLAFKFNIELTQERNIEDRISNLDDRLMNTQQMILSVKGKIDNLQFNGDILLDSERDLPTLHRDSNN